VQSVWRDTLRDLQWRRRRFVIAVVGASLVFAVTLLIGGLADSFRAEARRTVDALAIDGWVVRYGTIGPFTGVALVSADLAADMGRISGVRRADAIAILPQPVHPSKFPSAQVWGHVIGGIGTPPVTEGRREQRSGEAIVDDRLGPRVGAKITVGGLPFVVVGRTHGLTLFGGQPNLYVPIGDLQRISFNGLHMATAIAVRGHPSGAPEGMHVVSPEELRIDFLQPVKNAIGAIDTIRLLLWIVAGSIIGAVVYLSALERLRDFAVFKATGASTSNLFAGLMLQSTLLSVVASVLSVGVARLLVPIFPLSVDVPVSSQFLLVGVAVIIGGVASLFAVRRASTVDPAIAFGGP
jgi:putative ABC transport system permease protein